MARWYATRSANVSVCCEPLTDDSEPQEASSVPVAMQHAAPQRTGASMARRVTKANREVDVFCTRMKAGLSRPPTRSPSGRQHSCAVFGVSLIDDRGVGLDRARRVGLNREFSGSESSEMVTVPLAKNADPTRNGERTRLPGQHPFGNGQGSVRPQTLASLLFVLSN